jgi:integrase
MARTMNRLTDREARAAKGPAKLSDGGNLYLVIDSAGARRWLFRYRTGKREREMGLGPFPSISLAEARKRRDNARRVIADGRDPIDEKRAAMVASTPAVTFGAFAGDFITATCAGTHRRHAEQWTNSLKNYAGAILDNPIAEIDTDDVLAVLRPVWTVRAETAGRVRSRIERILDAAKVKGLRSGENPARLRGHLQLLLPKRPKLQRGHHRAVPFADMPGLMQRLRDRPAQAARALEFLILAAARTSEVTGAEWCEFDREARVWTVPASRMKRKLPHRVPLTERMLAILNDQEAMRRGPYAFPSFRADKPMSNGAFDALLERMKVPATTHGFRSSFRDWAGDATEFPRELAEAALSHAVGDEVERSYRRSDALERRRAMMIAWANYLDDETGST